MQAQDTEWKQQIQSPEVKAAGPSECQVANRNGKREGEERSSRHSRYCHKCCLKVPNHKREGVLGERKAKKYTRQSIWIFLQVGLHERFQLHNVFYKNGMEGRLNCEM